MRSVCLAIVLQLPFVVSAQIVIDILQHSKPDTTAAVRPIYHTISGYVTDSENGQPIKYANLMFDTLQFIGTFTDSTGLFTLKNVPIGSHNVKVSHIAYETTIL